jgi:hypothetical protein
MKIKSQAYSSRWSHAGQLDSLTDGSKKGPDMRNIFISTILADRCNRIRIYEFRIFSGTM